MAQAYVYEELVNSNLFSKIDWKNRVEDYGIGDEIELKNHKKYKLKTSRLSYDFTVTTHHNKIFNIIIRKIKEEEYDSINIKLTREQWKLFHNKDSILALVEFDFDNDPDITYTKKSSLNEII